MTLRSPAMAARLAIAISVAAAAGQPVPAGGADAANCSAVTDEGPCSAQQEHADLAMLQLKRRVPAAPAGGAGRGCSDQPRGWRSSTGLTCQDYVDRDYCTSNGGYGSGWWRTLWGSFSWWATDGVDASQACCGCGGGKMTYYQCHVAELNGHERYGMSFAFRVAGCTAGACTPGALLGAGLEGILEADAGEAGACGCWAAAREEADGTAAAERVFLFSFVPPSGGCGAAACWQRYAEVLRLFNFGSSEPVAAAEDIENAEHWSATCAETPRLEDDHALGLPTIAQIVNTLNGWDAVAVEEKILELVSVDDELSTSEVNTLSTGHGALPPADLRSALGHVAKAWDDLAASTWEWLLGLGVDALDLLAGEQSTTTILGTTFTVGNYYWPMLQYLIAGMTSKQALYQWYMDLSGGSKIGNGPGPNTTSYYAWQDVKRKLESLGRKIEQGRVVRRNELGMQILNGHLWAEAPGGERTILLGANRENHAFIRPILADVLDLARGTLCDGSTCWSPEWLHLKAKQFLQRNTIKSSDLKWFITQILHKLHMNIDLSEPEARTFAGFMDKAILIIPFPEEAADTWLVKTVLGIPSIQATRAAYLERYKKAIQAKFPGRTFSPGQLALVASAFMDSLLFAGGLSVPTVLQYVLALTHTAAKSKWPALRDLTLSDATVEGVLWETLRMYPPVAGFPYWEKVGGKWVHQIPNVAVALGDESVFSDPGSFKIRSLAEYRDNSIGWLDHATYPNGDSPESIRAPHSHRCPGKDLSFQIMLAFLKEFAAAGPWERQEDTIDVNAYRTTPFTLHKVSSAGQCWVAPKECVESWLYKFSWHRGCEELPDSSDRWCAHFKLHVPYQWSYCKLEPCETTAKHETESVKDTEKAVVEATASCKASTADAKSKAECVCSRANSVQTSKIRVQRCTALSTAATSIANPWSCVIKRAFFVGKVCAPYAPWYLRLSHMITRSWSSLATWGKGLLPTTRCHPSSPHTCSQSALVTKSATCSKVDRSVLSDDWLDLPKELQGVFWLQKQEDSSALISFGRTNDGAGHSPGRIGGDGKYRVRVGGDRSWSFATTDWGPWTSVEAVDLVYEFQFDNASHPTFAQIIPQARNFLGATVPPWLVSFDMRLMTEQSPYPESVVWDRVSASLSVPLEQFRYQIVQVIDAEGKRLPAFDEWVAYCEDPTKSGASSPGSIWYHAYTREPFSTFTLHQALDTCPQVLEFALPKILDAAFVLKNHFGPYTFDQWIHDPPLDSSVFDDFTYVSTLALIRGQIGRFGGANLTAQERMCPATETRPLDKLLSSENLAPLEEIDPSGDCSPSSTGQVYGLMSRCFFGVQRGLPWNDGVGSGPENTWSKALEGKGSMSKEAYVMSYFDNYKTLDGDPAYPAMETDYGKLFHKGPSAGWDDHLETKLALDILGSHLVSSVSGKAPTQGGETAELVLKLNQFSGFARRQGFARWGGDMYFSATGMPLMVEMIGADGMLKEVWATGPKADWEYAKWVFRSTLMNAVTLIDHLWYTHLSVANSVATVARERLLPGHPLRRLLSMMTFNTIDVNTDAGYQLLADGQILHRGSPFEDWNAVHDAGEDSIKTLEGYFGPIADAVARDALHPRMKRAPFYEDGPELFAVISKMVDGLFGVFADEWCDASTGAIRDQGVLDYAEAMEAWLRQERPARAAANTAWLKGGDSQAEWACAGVRKMVKVQMFAVSGFHQHVGRLADLARNPELVGLSWVEGEAAARPRQAMQWALVFAATAYTGVKLNEDFRPLFSGVPHEVKVKAVLKRFRRGLRRLQKKLSLRNDARDIPYSHMLPSNAEISVFQ